MSDIDNKIYFVQIVFVLSVAIASQNIIYENKEVWLIKFVQFILYLQLISLSQEILTLGYKVIKKKIKLDVVKIIKSVQNEIGLFVGSTGILVYTNGKIISEEFLPMSIAALVIKYFEIRKKSTVITYGTGMACNFYEGYLKHMLQSDGYKFLGFLENIEKYEQRHGVVFPVRKLFILIPKSLYCHPDLKMYNKENCQDKLPSLEACQVSDDEALEGVEKDMAGVKDRQYKNSAYMIRRPNGERPVYLAVESATPLHTLYAVLNDNLAYKNLNTINKEEVVEDFCTTLHNILDNSNECRNKCELVHFDDKSQNLASVLLDRIRELEPDFETIARDN